MKKLLLILLLLLPCFALAEELRIYQTTGEYDRVKLRESPGGRVIGQYYNNVLVTPLKQEGDWTYISIGGREGWMMSEFLLPVDEEWQASEGWRSQGEVGVPYASQYGVRPLYATTDAFYENVLLWMKDVSVEVLGTLDEEWLHVRVCSSDGQITYGYASAWGITWTENLGHAEVDTGDPAQRLNLRWSPSTSAEVRAQLYSGTEVQLLFDHHTNGDGWAKVRVGDLMGYVSEEYLNYSSAGVLPFEPPLCLLEDGRTAQVLAVQDNKLHVHLLATDSNRPYIWVSRSSVSHYTPRSVSTKGVTNCQVVATAYHTLPADHPVSIYGSFDPETNTHVWGYVHPDHPLLSVDFTVPNKNSMSGGYLPVDCVDFDPLLLAPTSDDFLAPVVN